MFTEPAEVAAGHAAQAAMHRLTPQDRRVGALLGIEELHGTREAVVQPRVKLLDAQGEGQIVVLLAQREVKAAVEQVASTPQAQDKQQGSDNAGEMELRVEQSGDGDGTEDENRKPGGTAEGGDEAEPTAHPGEPLAELLLL